MNFNSKDILEALNGANKDSKIDKIELLAQEMKEWIDKTILTKVYVGASEGEVYIYNEFKGVWELSIAPLGAVVERLIVSSVPDKWTAGSKIGQLKTIAKRSFYQQSVKPQALPFNKIVVGNGILDLETGSLIKHTPKFFATTRINANYDPTANNQDVLNFLDWAGNGCKDQRNQLNQVLGFPLMKDYSVQKAVVLYGSGKNGKSVFTSMIMNMLGWENTADTPFQKLGERFATSSLVGKMANIPDEADYTAMDKTAVLKAITGNKGVIQVEFKNKTPIQLPITAKMISASNHLPKSNDLTSGMWRRYLIIPFTKIVEKVDANIVNKISTDDAISTILNEAIKGYKQLITNGEFTETESSKALLEETKLASDPFKQWEREQKVNELITKPQMWDSYKFWMSDANYKAVGKHTFTNRLLEAGWIDKRTSAGRHWYKEDLNEI